MQELSLKEVSGNDDLSASTSHNTSALLPFSPRVRSLACNWEELGVRKHIGDKLCCLLHRLRRTTASKGPISVIKRKRPLEDSCGGGPSLLPLLLCASIMFNEMSVLLVGKERSTPHDKHSYHLTSQVWSCTYLLSAHSSRYKFILLQGLGSWDTRI